MLTMESAGFYPLEKRGILVPVLLALVLALPLFFASPETPNRFHFGWPQVYSGDEPHYLMMINSLISDGDLDLRNNYEQAAAGGLQAGKRFAFSRLDHHTVWFEDKRRVAWRNIYELDPAKWVPDEHGRPVAPLHPGAPAPLPNHHEYSSHPPGLALLLAPILYGFRDTAWVEPMAIGCSWLAVVLAMLSFRALAARYTADSGTINLVTAVAMLGTPAWPYARTLFCEPYLLLFAVGSYSMVLRGKSSLLAGTLIGLGILMKPPFAMMALPLWGLLMATRKLRLAAQLTLPILASVVVLLWMNRTMFGLVSRAAQPWLGGSFTTGAVGLLLSPEHGCLLAAPALLAAALAWPSFLRAYPREALVSASPAILGFVFFACYSRWPGGSAYGPRYLVPYLAFFLLALVRLPSMRLWQNQGARYSLIACGVLSVLINLFAALPYWTYWNTYPSLVFLKRGFNL